MTPTLRPGHLEIQPHEIARTVLRESGQSERDAVNPAQILAYLKLHHLSVDFAREFPAELRHRMSAAQPRAILSVADRIIATDSTLADTHTRFAVLHEIAHYLLPQHRHTLYVCDDLGMSARTRVTIEQEANSLAHELLFQGDRFSVDANDRPPTAAIVTALAQRYRASLEATASRIAQKSIAPCMMVMFAQGQGPAAAPPQVPSTPSLDPDAPPSWTVRYCVPSPAFATRHFSRISGSLPPALAARAAPHGRERTIAAVEEIDLPSAAGVQTHRRFRCELLRSGDDLIALIMPAESRRQRSAPAP